MPDDVEVYCEACGHPTRQRVIHIAASTGTELTTRCSECGVVSRHMIRERSVDVKYVLSRGGSSSTGKIRMFDKELISAGDELYLDGQRAVVTGVDTLQGRRQSAAASDIQTIWAKWFERCLLKISMNHGPRTEALEIEANPEEEFSVGDLIETDGKRMVVTAIKTSEGVTRRGKAEAADIVRIYARVAR